MENKQHLIRQEHEEQKEQISKLLESIRSEISNRPTRTGSTPHVYGTSFPTPGNSGYLLHNSTPIEAYPGLKGPPKFLFFSGINPIPKDKASFDQWIFQVKGACACHRPETIQSHIVNAVRHNTRELLGFVGFDKSLDITKMEERYDDNWSADRLQQEFYQLQQEKGEKIHQFVAQLEHRFRKLQAKFPDS